MIMKHLEATQYSNEMSRSKLDNCFLAYEILCGSMRARRSAIKVLYSAIVSHMVYAIYKIDNPLYSIYHFYSEA